MRHQIAESKKKMRTAPFVIVIHNNHTLRHVQIIQVIGVNMIYMIFRYVRECLKRWWKFQAVWFEWCWLVWVTVMAKAKTQEARPVPEEAAEKQTLQTHNTQSTPCQHCGFARASGFTYCHGCGTLIKR